MDNKLCFCKYLWNILDGLVEKDYISAVSVRYVYHL